jgi:hypothetical protein
MTAAEKRFHIYLTTLKALMTESAKKKNAALWLFSTDLRTIVFRLQGLARLYKKIHNKKLFEDILAKTKTLEDALGKVDYYAAFEKQFTKQKGFPAKILAHCSAQKIQALHNLQKILIADNWLNQILIDNWMKKCSTADWQSAEKDAAAIKKRFSKAIEKINAFVLDTKFAFDDIEMDVHELRRKIRWISIYAAALQGGVQLRANTQKRAILKKYLTAEIVQSPFNKMPRKTGAVLPIYCNKDEFLAMSWFIAKLGSIKDEGLATQFVQEAIIAVEKKDATAAQKRALNILGSNYKSLPVLLEEASAVAQQFFKDKVLDNLLLQ